MASGEDILNALDLGFEARWQSLHDHLDTLEPDDLTDWLKGIACKALGREREGRMWFERAKRDYDLFPDPKVELRSVFHEVVIERLPR